MSLTSTNFDRNARAADRRAHLRQPVRSLAYVELGDGNGGIALNISEGGMAVQAVMSLGGDDLPALRVQLSHSKKQIQLKGRVAWTADLRKLAGVQFVDVSDDTRRQLRDWISLESPDREFSVQAEISSLEPSAETPEPTAARPAASGAAAVIEVPLEAEESEVEDELTATSAPAIVEAPKPLPVAFPSRPRNPVVPAADVPPAFNPVAASSIAELPRPTEFPEPLETKSGKAASSAADVSSPINSAKPDLPKMPGLPSRLPSLPTRPAALPRKSASFFASAPAPEAPVARDPSFLPDDRFGFRRPEADSAANEATRISPAKWKTSTWVAIFALVALTAGWVAGHGSWRGNFQPAPGSDVNATVTEEDDSQPSAPSAPPPAQIEVIDLNNHRWMVPIATAAGRANAVTSPKNTNESEQASATSVAVASSAASLGQYSNSTNNSEAIPPVVSSSSGELRSVSPPTAAPSPKSDVVQNDLLPGELIHKVEPEYPAAALEQRVEGTVKIMAVIDVNGNVKSAQPLSGPRMLIPAALDAVRQWKYGPTTLHGQAIETQRQITIAFEVAKAD